MNSLEARFGHLLRELRIKKGFTQAALAIDSDLDRTYISMLERGKRMPTIGTLFRIAEVLGVSPSSIIRELER
jgi:transcriptional regulator with XRE-family HTH domain